MIEHETQQKEYSVQTKVLVIGAGFSGLASAEKIAEQGYEVHVLDQGSSTATECCYDPQTGRVYEQLLERVRQNPEISLKSGTKLKECNGFSGNFQILLENDREQEVLSVGAMVVATGYRCLPLFESYSLQPGKKVLSIGDLEKLLADDQGKAHIQNGSGSCVAFLSGFADEGNPVATQRMLNSALAVQDLDQCKSYVLAGNVKVAAGGMERLFTRSRNQGVTCIKPGAKPEVQLQEGNLNLHYTDPILREDVALTPDFVVLEERIEPDPQSRELQELLRIDTDHAGFFQTGNVHRLPVQTNREGIFVSGTAAAVTTPEQIWHVAADVALQVKSFLSSGTVTPTGNKAVVDEGRCVICLTCYRCCPHGAIAWEDKKAVISPIACQGCGICASECPMDAIQLEEYRAEDLGRTIQEGIASAPNTAIVAFCCQNSAFEAAQTAQKMGLDLPEELHMIQVPCAGTIDVDFILQALVQGAGAVVVLACHEGNCQSERGSTYAAWRIRELQKRLQSLAVNPDRLVLANLASNMPHEFARIIQTTADKLKSAN